MMPMGNWKRIGIAVVVLALLVVVGAFAAARAAQPAAVPAAAPAASPAASPADVPGEAIDRPIKGEATAAEATSDSAMALAGDKDGTVFGSLTVEEENRIQVEFERPELRVAIDPEQAPGLEWGTVVDVLDRSRPDFFAPLLAGSAGQPCPYMPRPYLERFGAGPVARFRPAVTGVESWRLLVVDSRGAEVAVFSGRGDPPKEIPWDGRTAAGELAEPGLTYSHVLEAQDRAGNRRRFVGEGFQIPPYRVQGGGNLTLMVSGRELRGLRASGAGLSGGSAATGGRSAAGEPEGRACLLEIASRLNVATSPAAPIVLRIKARDYQEANELGERLLRELRPLLLGAPVRLTSQALVEPGAPDGGTVMITTAGAAAAAGAAGAAAEKAAGG